MAGTIYGKVDCYSTSSLGGNTVHDFHRLTNEVWANLHYFMVFLYNKGIVEPVAGNLGAGGAGVGFWDGRDEVGSSSLTWGNAPYFVWKWKANANRPWDWYMYIQSLSGSVSGSPTPITKVQGLNAWQNPTQVAGYRDENWRYSGNNTCAILFSCAVLTGSVPDSPWNDGTPPGSNLINNAKGNPVWSTGSNPNNKLAVFPRTNYNLSALDPYAGIPPLIPAVDNNSILFTTRAYGGFGAARARYHFYADSDSFMFVVDSADTSNNLNYNYQVTYLGPFDLYNEIAQLYPTTSLLKTGSDNQYKGFMVLHHGAHPGNGPIGDAAIDSNKYNFNNPNLTQFGYGYYTGYFINSNVFMRPDAGLVANFQDGPRNFQVDAEWVYTYDGSNAWEPNYYASSSYCGRSMMVLSNEGGYQGQIGWLNSPLIRLIPPPLTSHDIATNGSKVVFRVCADGNNTSNRLLAPWSGSNAPGTVNNRNGFYFEIHTTSSLFPYQ